MATLIDLATVSYKANWLLYVEGRLRTCDWECQDGQKHYRVEVIGCLMFLVETLLPKKRWISLLIEVRQLTGKVLTLGKR